MELLVLALIIFWQRRKLRRKSLASAPALPASAQEVIEAARCVVAYHLHGVDMDDSAVWDVNTQLDLLDRLHAAVEAMDATQ